MIKDLKKICNPKVFEKVYQSYAKDVKRFLLFKTQDSALAEDILQEAFVKLWDNCEKVEFAKAKSFLFTVANNLFLNIKKHEQVKRKYQQNFVSRVNKENPEFILQEKEFLIKLEKAINNLPDKQKEVFLLNRMEKKKYKEIAEMLNISVKAVEKRMHLALKHMNQKIGKV